MTRLFVLATLCELTVAEALRREESPMVLLPALKTLTFADAADADVTRHTVTTAASPSCELVLAEYDSADDAVEAVQLFPACQAFVYSKSSSCASLAQRLPQTTCTDLPNGAQPRLSPFPPLRTSSVSCFVRIMNSCVCCSGARAAHVCPSCHHTLRRPCRPDPLLGAPAQPYLWFYRWGRSSCDAAAGCDSTTEPHPIDSHIPRERP